jgi:hypothetical protein
MLEMNHGEHFEAPPFSVFRQRKFIVFFFVNRSKLKKKDLVKKAEAGNFKAMTFDAYSDRPSEPVEQKTVPEQKPVEQPKVESKAQQEESEEVFFKSLFVVAIAGETQILFTGGRLGE